MARQEKSQRQLRVGEVLRHALVDILLRQKLHDTDIDSTAVTVTEVAVSPDLKNATAYCTVLGGRDVDPAVAGLNQARREIRRHLARAVALRFTPEIRFQADRTLDQASAIDALLKSPRVARDLQKPARAEWEPETPDK